MQSAHSMWLHGNRSGPSLPMCLLNDYINSPCHHDICLCSCIALQSVLKHRMGSKSPYDFVPPAQIRIVLTLRTVPSGWTLSQSIGYRGLSKFPKKTKTAHKKLLKWVCTCLQLPTQWQAVWFATLSTQKPDASKAIYPSPWCKCFTFLLLPNSHWLGKALLPMYDKMLFLLAPHLWELTCSSISPTVSRAAHLAVLLPSSSCTQ